MKGGNPSLSPTQNKKRETELNLKLYREKKKKNNKPRGRWSTGSAD